MPFVSQKQRAFLYSQHPEVAKKFAEHTTKAQEKSLPVRVKPKKKAAPKKKK